MPGATPAPVWSNVVWSDYVKPERYSRKQRTFVLKEIVMSIMMLLVNRNVSHKRDLSERSSMVYHLNAHGLRPHSMLNLRVHCRRTISCVSRKASYERCVPVLFEQ